ncbi:MAG: exosortase U [Planctomyces sp.]|nr:exosortase U [Planctomyces sp.]
MASLAETRERLIEPAPTSPVVPFADRLRGNRWVPAVVMAAFLPLVFWHLAAVLQKPHYQFLLVLPIAGWVLARERDLAPVAPRQRIWLASLLALISTAGALEAAWRWSPWLGAVSALVAAIPALWWIGGWLKVREWGPTWVLCWLAIPLPFGMDERLILRLRGVSTTMASHVLDRLGVLHLSYSNVIELPGKKLFVADACSGIHSLFVLMGASLFLGLWLRRRALHIALLLVATFGIVLIENVSRLVAIAVGVRAGVDLTGGAAHETLGFALFGVSLLLVATTDQLLKFLLPIGDVAPIDAPPDGFAMREAILRTSTWLPKAGVAWASVVGLAGFIALVQMPKSLPAMSQYVPRDVKIPAMAEDDLPERFEGFRRQRFDVIDRVKEDPFGAHSQQWTYESEDMAVVVSVDYPYDALHDLSLCYAAVGWRIPESGKSLRPAPETVGATEGGAGQLAQVNMTRPLFGSGLVIYSGVDASGRTGAMIKSVVEGDAGDQMARRLESLKRGRAPRAAARSEGRSGGPVVQIQLFAQCPGDIDDFREERLNRLYLHARELLQPKIVEALRQ